MHMHIFLMLYACTRPRRPASQPCLILGYYSKSTGQVRRSESKVIGYAKILVPELDVKYKLARFSVKIVTSILFHGF